MKRILFVMVIVAISLTPCLAVASDGHTPDSPVGLWIFRITFVPGAAPVYGGTARFRSDGTLSGPGKDGLKNSEVHGDWIRVDRREIAFTFLVDTYDASGNFVNTNKVRGMMTLSEDGVSAKIKTILDIIDTAGNSICPSPITATATATKIQAVPF